MIRKFCPCILVGLCFPEVVQLFGTDRDTKEEWFRTKISF